MSSQIYDEKIPQGWEVVKLGDVAKITMGQSPDGATYSNSPSKYILIQGNADIQNGFVKPRIWTTQITKIAYVGNIIMSVRAPAGAIGKTEYDAVIGRGVAAIEGNDFIYHILIKMDKDGYWDEFSCGSTFDSLKSYDIFNAKILMPKEKAEQERIAQVLGDMDDLISAKCELLDKKRAIKQAVAQQLLTPKPHWHTATLGGICKYIKTGKLDANAMEENGEFPFFTCAKNVYRINKYNFDLEALLISGNGANVGYIHYYKGKFNAYQRTYVLSDFSCNIFYLKNFLDLKLQERIEKEVRFGNTPYITMDTLVDMWISFPNLSEQTKIAEILSDMDDEISALQDEIEKLKMIKQGAMDELLSGKIRLKG